MVRVAYRVGTRHELERTAHGRAIVAFARDAGPRFGDVRRAGFAASQDELEPGVAGAAAPIFDRTGTPIGSIGVVGPSSRLTPLAVAGLVVTAAGEVSRALGHRA